VVEGQKSDATRKWSGAALEVATALIPEMIGGSADLTGSNNTRTAANKAPLTPENYGGRYVHWGIREHAMAAAMNGMALHGGVRPYGGTFMCFTDYARPSMRLSALMGLPVVYVMTHDSIGLGEDGPTHQPVESVAALRAIPNLDVIRPADPAETAGAFAAAFDRKDGPTLLALSRQVLPTLRQIPEEDARLGTLRGGYVAHRETAPLALILLATGSELHLAMEAVEKLAVQQTLDLCRGNKAAAARILEVTEKTIYNKLSRLGLKDPASEVPLMGRKRGRKPGKKAVSAVVV
jgi:transketolase